jgi:hypothetical protein
VNGELGDIFEEGVPGAGAVVDVLSWPLRGVTEENNENLSVVCVSIEIPIEELQITCLEGRAIAQVVSHWLPTAAARVWSIGICGGESGAGSGFPCQSSFHQILHPHNHPRQVQLNLLSLF